jgi:hypothetical protein
MNTRVANANHPSPNFQLTMNAGTLSIKFPKIQNLSKLSRLAIYHCEQASIALRYIDGFDLNACCGHTFVLNALLTAKPH